METKIAGDAMKVKLERKSVSIGPKKLSINDWLKEFGHKTLNREPKITDKMRAMIV